MHACMLLLLLLLLVLLPLVLVVLRAIHCATEAFFPEDITLKILFMCTVIWGPPAYIYIYMHSQETLCGALSIALLRPFFPEDITLKTLFMCTCPVM